MEKPFKGLKVVDLSTFVAAPVTGRMLADLGAEVVKIESPTGDTWRQSAASYVPERFTQEENPVFDIYNSGKKLICVNLKTDEGKEIFHRLIADADIFLTNVREGGLRRMGIYYDDLKERYPRLIFAHVTGYGHKGPDADLPAFDTTAFWSRTGFMRDLAVIGEDGAYNPTYPPSGVGDTVTAYLLLSEITMALYQREKTGRGQIVEASLYHTGIFTMGTMQVTCQRPFGRVYPKERPDQAVLGGYYKCKDGEYVFIGASMVQRLINQMAPAIGRMDLLEDPKYTTVQGRYENRRELYQLVSREFLKKTSDEWLAIARKFDFAMSKYASFADISEDEQAIVNGFVEKVEYPNGHTNIIATPPFHLEGLEGCYTTKPMPAIGGDTDEVLEKLGYTAEEIAAFKEKGAVKQAEKK